MKQEPVSPLIAIYNCANVGLRDGEDAMATATQNYYYEP